MDWIFFLLFSRPVKVVSRHLFRDKYNGYISDLVGVAPYMNDWVTLVALRVDIP